MASLADPEQCLLAVTMIAACGLLISTLQALCNWRFFRADGLMSWELIKTHPRAARYGPSPLLEQLFRFPNFLCLLVVQAVAALLLLVFPWHSSIRPVTLTLILSLCLLHRVRNQPYGLVASDTMNLLVFGALCLREIAPADPLATKGCLWFIALQSCLSYVANGVLKLQTSYWRQGTVLRAVAHHPVFGHARLARLLDRDPRVGKLLDWSVIGYEVAFPCVLVTGYAGCWIFLGGGVIFHSLLAWALGLNTFFFAWVATYPAIAWVTLHS
jgi:hypothetical protein